MSAAQLGKVAVMKAFFWERRREFFFGFVAVLGLSGVVRNELIRNGVIGRPRPTVDGRPKVERTFGKSQREKIE